MRREGFRPRSWDKSKFSVGLSTNLLDAPAIEEIAEETAAPEPIHKPRQHDAAPKKRK